MRIGLRFGMSIAGILACSVGAPNIASAAAVLDAVDAKDICPATGLVSKDQLARVLVRLGKVPIEFVDWNDIGVGYDDYVRVLTVQVCTERKTPAQDKKCTPGTADKAQVSLVQELAGRLREAAGSTTGSFELRLPNVTLFFDRKLQVRPQDELRYPALKWRKVSPAPEIFVKSPAFFDVSCKMRPRETAAGDPPNSPAMSAKVDPKSTDALLPNNVRLRAKPSDLIIGRDDSSFAGLSAASLAISDDRIADKATFDLHATLGYLLPYWQLGTTTLASILFVKYDRDYVDTKKTPPDSNIKNLGVGVVENLNFRVTEGFYANLSLTPQYIYSLKHGAEVSKVLGTFEPQPLVPYFGFAAPLLLPDFLATAYARALYNAGHVENAANDPNLAKTNNFTQAGVQVGGSLFNAEETSIFNGISLPIEYTYLHGYEGQYDTIRLFSASLNYTFPKTKYVTIGVSYVNGNNLDTFEKQQLLKASLGLKY